MAEATSERQQQSINEHVLKLTANGPRLIGSRCQDCGTYAFPRQSGCARCAGTNMEDAELGTEGELWAWTIQGFPPKNPPYLGAVDNFEPYGVGYVTINDQLKVEGRLTEADPTRLKSGMKMRLTTVKLFEEEGADVVTFAFEPVPAAGA